jgi:hypothetical protein
MDKERTNVDKDRRVFLVDRKELLAKIERMARALEEPKATPKPESVEFVPVYMDGVVCGMVRVLDAAKYLPKK